MLMHIHGSVIPEGPIDDFDECWEEIENFPCLVEMSKETDTNNLPSYIGLEDEKKQVLLISHPLEKEWVVMFGDSENILDFDELKNTIKNFFEGKLPEWCENKNINTNYFPEDIPDWVDRQA